MSRTLVLVLVLSLPGAAFADLVVPSARVHTRVVVRAKPGRTSRVVGGLRPGEQAQHLGSASGWRQVELPDGTRGFVSADWTELVPSPPPPEPEPAVETPPTSAAPPPEPQRSAFAALRDAILNLLPGRAAVDFHIREPEPDVRVYQNWDPNLPVSGLATPAGGSGLYDIVIVLDTSGSTQEFALADVDGNGVAKDEWNGADSIFQAEVAAARAFVRALGRLPGNVAQRRIRVGLVSFAGDGQLRRRPSDKDFRPVPASVVALARRDAVLHVPLVDDYARIEAALDALAGTEPRGMTDVAAGLGLATLELRGGEDAHSQPRRDAVRIVQFLTDGTPSLPYDEPVAEHAAEVAARMAGRADVRINIFQIGRNAVTRKPNATMIKLAHWTDGNYVALETPGDIVSVLEKTSLSFVDRVKLVNHTTEHESDYIATGIDGSFYGEIPLREGPNEIAVRASLPGGRHAEQRFTIVYRRGAPEEELEARLASIRQENEALIQEIRRRLALEIERERTRRELEVRGEASP